MSSNKDHLSCGFIGLLTKMEKHALPQLGKGVAAFVLADHNFRETMKVATFTKNESWYRRFCSLLVDDGKASLLGASTICPSGKRVMFVCHIKSRFTSCF